MHLVSRGEYDSPDDGVCVAELLLERGTDVNAQNQRHQTPLHTAFCNGKLTIAQLLLDNHGAKVDTVDVEGNTLLHEVSRGQYNTEEVSVGFARLLLERGANVNVQGWSQWTPLHVSSHFLKVETTRLLLNHGAKVDAVDSAGKTPFDVTPRYRSEAALGIAQLLSEHGADKSTGGSTPLHLASYKGELKTARLLLDNGANVGAVDSKGATPLHDASYCKVCSEEQAIGVARLLLEHGGDVNAQAKTRWTPLHVAAYRGSLGIARLLLDHGAEVDTVDDEGNTPLHYISEGKYIASKVGVARLLLEHGADVNAKARSGKSPLDLALRTGRNDVAQFLREYGGRAGASSSLIGYFKR